MKLFKGNHPGVGYQQIATVEDEGADWLVLAKTEKSNDWENYKIISVQPVHSKANYWLGWNGKRFQRMGDASKMMEHRLGLLKKIEAVLLERAEADEPKRTRKELER